MARYFKLVEIDVDSFVDIVGEDLAGCDELVAMEDGVVYVAIDETVCSEIEIDLNDFEEQEDY